MRQREIEKDVSAEKSQFEAFKIFSRSGSISCSLEESAGQNLIKEVLRVTAALQVTAICSQELPYNLLLHFSLFLMEIKPRSVQFIMFPDHDSFEAKLKMQSISVCNFFLSDEI